MENMYDVIILGFEPAALSLAIALHEQPRPLKILILDPKQRFSWSGSTSPLPGARMKTSLLQDLVTPRNPLSDFTFVNYLWSTGSLVDYTNLSLINPPTRIFAHYLAWAASKVEALGLVRYNQHVCRVEPLSTDDRGINAWRIAFKSAADDTTEAIYTKRVVVAVTPEPVLPSILDGVRSLPSVVHASRSQEAIASIRQDTSKALKVAILGGNDEAVEIFQHINCIAPQAIIKLYLDEPTLRQTDCNPFLIEAVQQPGRLPHELQSALCTQNGSKSVIQTIDSANISKLYLARYIHSVKEHDRERCSSDICTFKKVIGATAADSTARVLLQLEDIPTGKKETSEPFDHIIAVSGYARNDHKRLMTGLHGLIDSYDGRIDVDSEYRVNLKRNKVVSEIGIWILDGLENQALDVFSYLALRTERVLQSILNSSDAGLGQSTTTGTYGARAAL